MDTYKALEFAQEAVEKVSHIATALGETTKRTVCGRLGAELFIAANHLKSAGPDQEDQVLRKIEKLLRDTERICSWPADPEDNYPFLRGIVQAIPGTHSYKLAEEKIRRGLISITAGKGKTAEDAILHLQKLTRRGGIRKPNTEELNAAPKSTPPEYPNDVKVLVYDILCKHMCCACSSEAAEKPPEKRHLAMLLLRPAPTADRKGNVQLDMLFSSAPLRNGSTFGCWQDVQLLVPRVQQPSKGPKKRTRFADSNDDPADSQVQKSLEDINHGQFCKLISLETDARLCLKIQGGKLQRFLDSEPRKQIVEHTLSISLATILQNYHLTPKMKAILAYILAQSVWQFYDSDWMKTRWTSETIQFMKQYIHPLCEGEPNVFASKPYFSVRFGEDDVDACEATSTAGEIHRYPRVRALGIMLVEIGIGSLLPRSEKKYEDQPQTLKINEDWSTAKQYSDLDEPWPDFDYGKYRTAVKNCLNPRIFAEAPFSPKASSEELAEGLKKRRKILHDCVVFPLEELIQGTGWKDEVHKIGPLQSHTRPTPAKLATDAPQIQESAKSAAWRDQKNSKQWLMRINELNKQLKSTSLQNIPQVRIRIAILDTGYDADAVFFQHHTRRNRLIKWKDWVEDARKPQDCHGHGTHLVSLIMKMAPEADICVARVARDPRGLENASENVAKAIEWAQSKCEADIISMSFGFIHDQQSISKAIRSAVNARNESILFFAAAANSGANEREMFPARHECVISIRGTNSDGRFQDFNPPRSHRENTVFGTLGLEVPSASLSHETGEVYRKGTSIATAVAAGMAGMLLGYVNGKSSKSTYHTVREKLRTREGILSMFESIACTSLDDGYLYVAPWDLEGIPDETRWSKFEAAVSKMP